MTTAIRKALTDLAKWYIDGVKIRELFARGGCRVRNDGESATA